MRYQQPASTPVEADRRRILLLQLDLPGGTRFLGRVSKGGCAHVDAVTPNALALISDERDARLARTIPIGRGEAEDMAAELNPDVVHRLLYRPGLPTVVYARARDEIPDVGQACPLLLALEMLGAADERPRGMLILALGGRAQPDLVLMVGRDRYGAIDPASLQAWLLPQDDLLTLARDFADRGRFELPEDQLVYTQHELLQLAPRLPYYERGRTYFGRTADHWARTSLGLIGGVTIAVALACGGEAIALARVEQQQAQAQARIAQLQERLRRVAQTDPLRLAVAASVNPRELTDAARAIWRSGVKVRIEARPGKEQLTLNAPLIGQAARDVAPTDAAPGADPETILAAMSQLPPRGFARGPIQLSGDFNAVAITYQSESRRSAAAGLFVR